MEITFDPVKNKANIQSHGIDLAEIEAVFYDPNAITREDRDHDEERFVTLASDGLGRILVVAYHYRGDSEIRVISARLADPKERRFYQGGEI